MLRYPFWVLSALVGLKIRYGFFGKGIQLQKMKECQEATRVPVELPYCKNVEEIGSHIQKVRYTGDPAHLDLLRHASYMQQAIQIHPDFSGDCEDFANYWAASLFRNDLATKVFIDVFFWYDEKDNKFKGHAVCLFCDKIGEWSHVGNYYNNVPLYVGFDVNKARSVYESYVKKKILLHARYNVSKGDKDTVNYTDVKILYCLL